MHFHFECFPVYNLVRRILTISITLLGWNLNHYLEETAEGNSLLGIESPQKAFLHRDPHREMH